MRSINPVMAGALALVALLPDAALAQETRAGELAERLNDPATQYAVAGVLSAMSKAVLDMEVAPFVKAMEGMGARPPRDLPADATVADVAGTSQAEVRDKLVDNVPRMMSAMGGLAQAVEDMLPQLEGMAKKMKDAIPAP